MEPIMQRTPDNLVNLFDDKGNLIGTIVRPVTRDVLGPGAEKVYLARLSDEKGVPASRSAQHAA